MLQYIGKVRVNVANSEMAKFGGWSHNGLVDILVCLFVLLVRQSLYLQR